MESKLSIDVDQAQEAQGRDIYQDYLEGMGEDMDEQKLLNMVIVDLNGRDVNLKMV